MRVCLTSSHWLLRWKWKYSNQSCNYDCWSCGFSKIELVILGDLMMHIIYFKILLQGHWLSCGAFFVGLSIMQCGGVCHGWRRAEILSQLQNICSQMKTAWDFDSESSHFAKAHKYLLRNIWKKNFFSGSRSFSCLRLHGLMMIFQFAGLLSIMECFGSQSRIFFPSGSEVLCLKINVCPLCLLAACVPTYNSAQARAKQCVWQNHPIRF